MDLFLLRHGHAEPEAPKDCLRELSMTGKLEVQQACEKNISRLQHVEEIIISPYVRAQQTAEIVVKCMQTMRAESGQVTSNLVKQTTSDLLVPTGNPQALIDYLHSRYHKEGMHSLMLIGHQPLLGVLLDALVAADPGRYRLCTASLAGIDTEVLARGCGSVSFIAHVER